jgi:hypothetical protein
MESFDYAIVRVVPDVAREEFLNVGAVLFCHAADFLEARIVLDRARLLAFSPSIDLATLEDHLQAFCPLCEGGPEAGPLGLLPRRERWHWLVAPRSTIVQCSPPHTGMCDAPGAMLERIVARMVKSPVQDIDEETTTKRRLDR